MPRPRRCRRIRGCPKADLFKPRGFRLRELETVTLAPDEYEAIRLVLHEKLDQQAAATKMEVSQPTLNRILKSGEGKMAEAIVEGKALSIGKTDGGEKMPNKDGTGPDGKGPMTGRKMGPCNTDEPSAVPRQGLGRGRGFGGGRRGRGFNR